MGDLVHDLAIVLAGAQRSYASLGPSPKLAVRRIREELGWTDCELSAGIEDRLRAALDGREPGPLRDIIWRQEVQPGLAVVVEDSGNVLLELANHGTGVVRGRTEPLGDADLMATLVQARVFVAETTEAAEAERRAHLAQLAGERRRAERAPADLQPGEYRQAE
jgi:hypothetical protein